MGREFDENVRLLQGMQPEHSDRKKMQAGRYDPTTGLADPNIYNGLDAGFIWVRDRGSRVAVPAIMSVLTAMCAIRFDDLIRTGINEEGDREAIAPYIIRQNVNKLNQVLYESKKLTPTTTEALEGGIVRAPDTPALQLYVGANDALGWAGGLIDVDAADEPANPNEFRWLVVRFTGVYGATPVYTPTAARVAANVDSFKALYLTDAFDEPLPNGSVRHWGVTLGNGQSTITYTESRFVHLRNIYNPDWLVTAETSSALDGYVPTWNTTLEQWIAAAQTGSGGVGTAGDDIIIIDQKSPGTNGGTLTAATWTKRDLQTIVVNVGSHASLSSSQITLAAGTYRCKVYAPAFYVNRHQARLRDITNSATIQPEGSTAHSPVSGFDETVSVSIIDTVFTIAGTTVFEVQHNCSTTNSGDGAGTPGSLGANEIYTIVHLIKIA